MNIVSSGVFFCSACFIPSALTKTGVGIRSLTVVLGYKGATGRRGRARCVRYLSVLSGISHIPSLAVLA